MNNTLFNIKKIRMNKFTVVAFFLSVTMLSCDKEDIRLFLNAIDPQTFYSEEVIPEEYQNIYGKWSLYDITGGFIGTGHEPNHDYLEIKSIGIYGIVRNDSLLEFGKIKLDTFDTRTTEYLQIRLVPESSEEPFFYPQEKYIQLNESGKMVLRSPCCDMYDYHYEKFN